MYELYRNVITSADIDKLITSVNFQPLKASYTGGRKNQYAMISAYPQLLDHIMDVIHIIDRRYTDLEIELLPNEHPNFILFKYEPGDHFNLFHIDINDSSSENTSHQRRKTVIVSLSHTNDYEGGRLELQDIQTPTIERGSMIVFNSDHPHRVTPVTSGCRISLIVWLVQQ